jgi:hypothetical protein
MPHEYVKATNLSPGQLCAHTHPHTYTNTHTHTRISAAWMKLPPSIWHEKFTQREASPEWKPPSRPSSPYREIGVWAKDGFVREGPPDESFMGGQSMIFDQRSASGHSMAVEQGYAGGHAHEHMPGSSSHASQPHASRFVIRVDLCACVYVYIHTDSCT